MGPAGSFRDGVGIRASVKLIALLTTGRPWVKLSPGRGVVPGPRPGRMSEEVERRQFAGIRTGLTAREVAPPASTGLGSDRSAQT